MKKLPNWANCWIVSDDGAILPAHRYEKSYGFYYYDEHGSPFDMSQHREHSNAGWWVVVLIILTVSFWGLSMAF